MWSIWGAFVIMFAAITVYIGTLSRDEEDQIFLDDAFSHVKSEQDAIAAKVAKVQPIKKLILVLLGVMTLVVIGYYVIDIFNQFH